ncbi:flagellar hook capping protein (plasmid) [Sphingomonas paeninsulae]|uniref:Basal-body rod modification protein FlgD n=1 Tax=Sphingomonas paeninsulae TaxID=2319844 RepID=A0A494TJA7_SPHPE|nr:flagellar hook capping FlgD N-terminal domain-containing protein [Sphingomonas paeninsulae]AYJ85215.1 flagellar hook capping protein [Sphingomonas paeninsulae]
MTTTIDTSGLTALNATTKATGSAALDQNSFLKLMTTQLNAQDPFNPMDNSQMVAQMAQFSSVAGITEMNASLKAIAAQLDTTRVADAAGWIGKSALVAADFVNKGTTGTYSGQINLDTKADSVIVDLLDKNGLILNTQDLGGGTGPMPFHWDGNTTGDALRVRVTAKSGTTTVATTTNVWTPITAVQSPGSGTSQRLVTPNGLIAPSAAISLS